VGLFSGIADIFGSVQQKRAAEEAQRMFKQTADKAFRRSDEEYAMFSPLVSQAQAGMRDSQGMLEKIMAQTQGMQTGPGLSDADKIAYQDAAKLLNEQMVGTGNLRSGAAAFGQSELLRRVVADANQRQFGRQVAQLQLLFGGQNQAAQHALGLGQIGTSGMSLSNQLFNTGTSMVQGQAGMEMTKGQTIAQQIGAFGGIADAGVNMGAGYAMGGAGGAMMGGQNMAQLGMMQQLFGGGKSVPTSKSSAIDFQW